MSNFYFQVLPSKDPLDQPDLNITEYINSIFPTEQSLNNIDDVISNLESKILSIEDEMRTVIRGQTNITEVSNINFYWIFNCLYRMDRLLWKTLEGW